MLLRFLDRFEEVLISVLMALAVVLIFVAVVHRFSLGAAADLVPQPLEHLFWKSIAVVHHKNRDLLAMVFCVNIQIGRAHV